MNHLTLVAVGVAATLAAATEAEAQTRPTAVHLDFKTESHNTVMTAPIAGPFVGVSHAVAPRAALHPRAWAGLGTMFGLESQGLAGEIGASATYYGKSRHDGIGVTLGGGLSLLKLHQQHDGEELVAGALILEPGVVYTRGRVSFLVGVRGKSLLFERLSTESMTSTSTDYFLPWQGRKEESRWKFESGLKAGLAVAL